MTELIAFMAGGAVVFIIMAVLFSSKCADCEINATTPSIEGMRYDIEEAREKETVMADVLCGNCPVCGTREEVRRGESCG